MTLHEFLIFAYYEFRWGSVKNQDLCLNFFYSIFHYQKITFHITRSSKCIKKKPHFKKRHWWVSHYKNIFLHLTNIVLRLDTGSISAQPWKPSSLEKTLTGPIHWKTFHSQLLQEVNEANWFIKLLWILLSDVTCCTLRERLAAWRL